METPLTPMEFARRARRLYAEREAVVDVIDVHLLVWEDVFVVVNTRPRARIHYVARWRGHVRGCARGVSWARGAAAGQRHQCTEQRKDCEQGQTNNFHGP